MPRRLFEEAICKRCKGKFYTNDDAKICDRCLMELDDELDQKIHAKEYAEEAYWEYRATEFKKGE